MKAVLYTQYGAPEVLHLAEIPLPEPEDHEIRVRVQATSVTSGTQWARQGKHPDSRLFTLALRAFMGFRGPRNPILGYEFAGQVEAVGKNVTRFQVGDQVFGTTSGLSSGAYAEALCMPEARKSGVVALSPPNLPPEAAAVVPIGGMTALYLLKKAKLQQGQGILIYGASGSVGSYAIQLAKHHFGATVTGVCSTGNLEWVRALGADHMIDYTQTDFTQQPERYDVIFDAVGKLKGAQAKSVLKPGGKYLSVKTPTQEKLEDLQQLSTLIEAEKIWPVIDKTYPLEAIVEAHHYVDTGRKKGNVVITVNVN